VPKTSEEVLQSHVVIPSVGGAICFWHSLEVAICDLNIIEDCHEQT